MSSLYRDFVNGTTRERLAIAADLFSLAGVSAAAVIAPLFAANLSRDTWAAFFFLPIWGLIVVAGLAGFLAVTIAVAQWVQARGWGAVVTGACLTAVWALYAAVVVLAIGLSALGVVEVTR